MNYSDNIVKYIKKQLSAAEIKSFENEININASLKAEYENEKLLHSLFSINDDLEFIDNLKEIHQNDKTKNNIIKFSLIGFAVALCSYVVYNNYSNPEDNSTEKPKTIINQHFNSNIPSPTTSTTFTQNESKKIIKENTQKSVTFSKLDCIYKDTSFTHYSLTQFAYLPDSSLKKDNPEYEKRATQHLNAVQTCQDVNILASFIVTNTCEDSHNGNLILQKISNGTGPYTTTVFDENSHQILNSNLSSGKYFFIITDAHNCSSEKINFEINTILCPKNYFLDLSIGEKWTAPVFTEKTKILIVDKSGNKYFSKSVDAGELFEWNGQSVTGNTVAGYYLLLFENEQGNIVKNTLTIKD
ncbi:MAG: hypothetical protein U0V72_14225 [Cytophagales bacterium]